MELVELLILLTFLVGCWLWVKGIQSLDKHDPNDESWKDWV